MKAPFACIISFQVFFLACSNPPSPKGLSGPKEKNENNVRIVNSENSDSIFHSQLREANRTQSTIKSDTLVIPTSQSYTTSKEKHERSSSLISSPEPSRGYRYNIIGDFDGDGQQERLSEHYCSALDDLEMNKVLPDLKDFDEYIAAIGSKKPYTYLTSDNHKIDTLIISNSPQSLGLLHLKNEGDLNNDGSDEISYVPNWADKSGSNYCHIATLTDTGWHEILNFFTFDEALPLLPFTQTKDGYVYLYGIIEHKNVDSLSKAVQLNRRHFKGLIQKTGPYTFSFHEPLVMEGRTDSVFVDMRKPIPTTGSARY